MRDGHTLYSIVPDGLLQFLKIQGHADIVIDYPAIQPKLCLYLSMCVHPQRFA